MSAPALSIELAPATLADVSGIYHVAELSWRDTFAAILTPEQLETALATSYSAERLTQYITTGEQQFQVLRENGAIVAYAAVSDNTTELPATVEQASLKLDKLYCLPACHGKGYGRQLMTWVEGEATRRDCKAVHLCVNRSNPSVRFYEAGGFTVVHELNQWYEGIYREDFVMMKRLETRPDAA